VDPSSLPPRLRLQRAQEEEEAERRAKLLQRLRADHPDGVPCPDPNQPWKRSQESVHKVPTSASVRGATPKSMASMLHGGGGGGGGAASERRIPPGKAPPVISARVAAESGGAGKKQGAAKTTKDLAKETKAMEAQYGKRVAKQLAELAARGGGGSTVRKQESRFSHLVEEERAAKRQRKLAELEVKDKMAERMEQVKSINVRAWKCKQCRSTTDSLRCKQRCEELGHELKECFAKRTRWQCGGCGMALNVLDRELPNACQKCNGGAWKQVSMNPVKMTSMPKDQLLPRGEELPFLGSIPKSSIADNSVSGSFGEDRKKAAADDYAGMDVQWE